MIRGKKRDTHRERQNVHEQQLDLSAQEDSLGVLLGTICQEHILLLWHTEVRRGIEV